MSSTEFIPIGPLGDAGDGTTADFARSRGRWQALPDGWLSAEDMRAELMRIARVPEYDNAAGEALLWSMSDWLEVRGPERARKYRRVETPPEPMGPAQIFEAETARRAELDRERFEREEQARIAASAERDAIYLANNRQVHRELADEYTVPMIRALEAQVAQLEAQLAQHAGVELRAGAAGELEADATPAPIGAPAESMLAQTRRWMFGDATEADVERLLEEEEDDD